MNGLLTKEYKCDYIEKNYVYDEKNGKLLYVQYLFCNWTPHGVVIDNSRYYNTNIECPDYIKLNDKYILRFSELFSNKIITIKSDFLIETSSTYDREQDYRHNKYLAESIW